MSIRKDYLLKQVENLAKLIASVAFKKPDHKQEVQIEQALSEITGLDGSWFNDPEKAPVLSAVLGMLPHHDQKALVARLLSFKGPAYSAVSSELSKQVDPKQLSPQVKSVLEQ